MNDIRLQILSESISDSDFKRLSSAIYDLCGISLSEDKKSTVEARIRKRIIQLKFTSYNEYFQYLFSKNGWVKESIDFIDVLTTNKTEFFRESNQIDYMIEKAVPELVEKTRTGISKELKIWSAGCSTGEEPYSIAMALSNFAEQYKVFVYRIFATDISTKVLEKATLGIYDNEEMNSIPLEFRKKYLLRSKNVEKQIFRIIPEIRNRVNFSRLNLINETYNFPGSLDIIFCRNVIIYFDKKTQESLLINFCKCLNENGLLFLGHSESIVGMKLPLKRISSTIYRVVK